MSSFQVINPYNQKILNTLNYHNSDDVENALTIAHKTERSTPLQKTQRLKILREFYRLCTEHKTELIDTAISEGGKPYRDSVVEIERGFQGIETAIQALSQLAGREIPMGITPSSSSRLSFTHHQPLGLVVALSAFNHPFNLIIHQVIPALAAGCPFILKPSSATPLSAMKVMELLKKAGLPNEYGQLLHLKHHDATKLATDPRVRALNFIGSAAVGWNLKSCVAPGVRVTLEHGGVAPVILAPDALSEQIAPSLVRGCFYHAGQVCVSVQKIYVHQDQAEDFQKVFVQETQKLIVGDPHDAQTDVGPLINAKELERVHLWVNEATEKGATLLYGGDKLENHCFQPTILLNVPKNCRLYQEEIFGPVVMIETYDHIDEVIDSINSTPFAFQAGLYGQNIDWLMRSAQKLYAQTVMINDHSAFRVDWMPFGGLKNSGIGLGGIENTLKEYCVEKLYVMKLQDS